MHIQCCSGLQRARPQESQAVTPIGFSFAACSYTQFQKKTDDHLFTAVLGGVRHDDVGEHRGDLVHVDVWRLSVWDPLDLCTGTAS